jgi:hypothetical protein
MSSSTEKDYDTIKNPRPEDLHAYGVVNALIWFGGLLLVGVAIYYLIGLVF